VTQFGLLGRFRTGVQFETVLFFSYIIFGLRVYLENKNLVVAEPGLPPGASRKETLPVAGEGEKEREQWGVGKN
jgi:hypothetical protein